MFTEFAALPEAYHIGVALILGMLVGSFLNVVIFRYPEILKFAWSKQSYEWLNEQPYNETEPDGIASPASRCGSCGHSIKPWQNIPIISYLILRGRCSNCQQAISIRYPLVELLTGLLSAFVVFHFGWSLQAAFAVLLSWALVTLSFIDFDHQLLPDDIVMPMLWLGLGLSLIPVFALPADAIIGAIAGYLALWCVFKLFKAVTGKEGMGYGDFKLLALFGAWLGWQYLPQIVLISTLVGSFVGLSLIIFTKQNSQKPIPFGPYIAVAGWIAMLWGDQINTAYLRMSGL